MENTRYQVTVWVDTAIHPDRRADCTVTPAMIIDIGNGVEGIVGQIVGITMSAPHDGPLDNLPTP